MRWGLISWCLAGVLALALKAHLDLTSLKYNDIAVRAGQSVYLVPRALVTNADSWRADVARLSGCWDAREAGMISAAGVLAGCEGSRALHLDLSRFAGSIDPLLARYAQGAAFWRNYQPPAEQLRELIAAYRHATVTYRSDWQLYRVAVPGTPWVYLLAGQPGSPAQVAGLFAGRCFKSDTFSDIGMSCSFVERLEGGAALEYSFGPDAVPDFATLRAAARVMVTAWRRD